MVKQLSMSARRSTHLMVLACLMIVIFALAACGGDNMSTSTSSSGNAATGNNSNGSNGAASVATINIKEKQGASGDVYMCDPETLKVKKGDTVTFANQSDEIQDFDQGDAQKAGVDFKMNLNQSTTATFNTVGTFVIKSEKGAKITVTVE